VRSWKESDLQRGADRTGDPTLTSKVFHAMDITLSLKLGDHEGLALFVHSQLLKRTLLVVLPAILKQIPVRASLSTVPVCWGQYRTACCCPAADGGMPTPSTQLLETQCQFCIFCVISLIINIISIISATNKTFYIRFVSLSPFSSFSPFSLPLVGGWGLTESVCHSPCSKL